MNKILIISRKEFLSILRNRLFIIIALMFLILSILSVYIGSTTKKAEMRVYNERVATLTQQGYSDLPPKPEIKTLTILFNLTEYISIVGAILAVVLGYDTLIHEKESGSLKLILSHQTLRAHQLRSLRNKSSVYSQYLAGNFTDETGKYNRSSCTYYITDKRLIHDLFKT